MKLSLGFSPCPNDTFIFDALVNQKIDTEGLDFEILTADVQELNRMALENKLDISKISYGVLPLILNHYNLLSSGGALGFGVGPLLVTAQKEYVESIPASTSIALPGKNTTAHLLFSLAYPQLQNKSFLLFSDIENAVIHQEYQLGVIIHENRFTYQEKGLLKIADLGEIWEKKTGNPIPLGGIVIKKTHPIQLATTINRLIRKSIEYAFEHHYAELSDYVVCHAQEMKPEVMRQHIDLYVNKYSLNLEEKGRNAVEVLIDTYQQLNPSTSSATLQIISN
jgi:1,4-dihydroxy-6-naphthoate synthase